MGASGEIFADLPLTWVSPELAQACGEAEQGEVAARGAHALPSDTSPGGSLGLGAAAASQI